MLRFLSSVPGYPALTRFAVGLVSWLGQSRSVWLFLCLAVVLSGCIQYDLDIQFDNSNRGRIVQHIRLEERLKNLSGDVSQECLDLIERRTRRLGGEVQRLPHDELVLTVPFSSSADLESKFNHFFPPPEPNQSSSPNVAALPEIESHLDVTRSNLLLVERNHLRYSLDLRSLGVMSASGELLISPRSLINLEFRLRAPWGIRNLSTGAGETNLRREGQVLIWHLVPGELNQIEAVFWLPSPLGIGTLVIVGLMLVGTYLKYPHWFRFQATDHTPPEANLG